MLPNNPTPRPLTEKERRGLFAALARAYDLDAQHLEDDPPCHACWDYISDGPGYAGPVVVILWDGGPELVESWVVRGDQWEAVG